jgi:hypothetical protein
MLCGNLGLSDSKKVLLYLLKLKSSAIDRRALLIDADNIIKIYQFIV